MIKHIYIFTSRFLIIPPVSNIYVSFYMVYLYMNTFNKKYKISLIFGTSWIDFKILLKNFSANFHE